MLPDLPLPNGEFDVVTGNFVIQATGDPAAALAELRRVLRPGRRRAGAHLLTRERRRRRSALAREAIEAAGVAWPEDVPGLAVPAAQLARRVRGAAGLGGLHGYDGPPAELGAPGRVREWWEVYRSSVGSNGAVIARQDDATIERIKTEFDRLAARYATGDGLVALPAAAVLATGTRP